MPAKAIPPARDRLQSRLLVWTIAPLLIVLAMVRTAGLMIFAPHLHPLALESVGLSLCFAILAWRVKAATPAAAATGGVICLYLIYGTHIVSAPVVDSALIPLITLFILTSLATSVGKKWEVQRDLAESRSGRTMSQVIANLGAAALLAFPVGLILVFRFWPSGYVNPDWVAQVLVLSALCEATADTVSSEIGQTCGGVTRMITNLRRVQPGTDGAISLRGTVAGTLSAITVAASGAWSMHLSLERSGIAIIAGICGMFFDSLLGATVERRGWIGNDLVNFSSTVFSSAISLIAILLVPGAGPRPFVMY